MITKWRAKGGKKWERVEIDSFVSVTSYKKIRQQLGGRHGQEKTSLGWGLLIFLYEFLIQDDRLLGENCRKDTLGICILGVYLYQYE